MGKTNESKTKYRRIFLDAEGRPMHDAASWAYDDAEAVKAAAEVAEVLCPNERLVLRRDATIVMLAAWRGGEHGPTRIE